MGLQPRHHFDTNFRSLPPKLYPPPLVQATVNNQKLTEPTPRVAWTRALLTRRNLRDTRVDMMYYSDKSPLGQQSRLDTKYKLRASQNQSNRRHTWHTAERIENRTAKINGAKIDGTNAECCLDIGVAWTLVLLGHRRCLAIEQWKVQR